MPGKALRTLVVATTNAHKLTEIRRILTGLDWVVESIAAYSDGASTGGNGPNLRGERAAQGQALREPGATPDGG